MQLIVFAKLRRANNQTYTNCQAEMLDIKECQLIPGSADLIFRFAELIRH